MDLDPATVGEFLEQRAIESARGTVIDIFDGSLMAQPGISQAGEQAPVASIANLLIEQQAEPFGMGQRGGFTGCFDLTEGLGHAVETELMQQIEGGLDCGRGALMLDNPEKTARLLAALKAAVPFKVELVPSLVTYLRAQHVAIADQTQQIVSNVSYAGNDLGIEFHIAFPA